MFELKEFQDDKLMCNAYLKSKLYMAKIIYKQQKEIEYLKEQLISQTNRNNLVCECLNNLNDRIYKLESSANKDLDVSGELIKSIDLREHENKNEGSRDENVLLNDNEKIMSDLKKENLDLRKELEKIKTENLDKQSSINRLTHEKFLLFMELDELVNSLRKVDLNLLNDFYLKNNNRTYIPAAMGMKFNIMSAFTQLNLLSNIGQPNVLKFMKDKDTDYFNSNRLGEITKYYEKELDDFETNQTCFDEISHIRTTCV